MTIRVILADDHRMVREGLRSILEREPDIAVVGEADDGHAAVELAVKLSPHLVLMDVGMPVLNGIDATREILRRSPRVGVVGLSTHSDRRYVLAMVEAGARGYVIKEAAGEELIGAIRSAFQGHTVLSPAIAGAVVDGYLGGGARKASRASLLGARERQVLQLLAEGSTSKEIATCLGISPATVEVHRRNIMRKLDLHSVAELTKYAIREGLTQP